jgi:uncharacterized membrane protein
MMLFLLNGLCVIYSFIYIIKKIEEKNTLACVNWTIVFMLNLIAVILHLTL